MDTVECRPILVVDDDLDACEALSEFLKLNGYTVACAENEQIALAEIRTRPVPPALILLDMLMPVMDGQTFLTRARQGSSYQGRAHRCRYSGSISRGARRLCGSW